MLVCLNRNLIVLSMTIGPAVLVQVDTGKETVLSMVEPFEHKAKNRMDYNCAVFDVSGHYLYVGNSIGQMVILRVSDLTIVSQFHVSTNLFCIAQSTRDIASNVNRVDDLPQKLKKGDFGIKHIVFSRTGKYLLVNCSNFIRLYQDVMEDHTQYVFAGEFRDPVTGDPYVACGFSGVNGLGLDSEFVVATTRHKIYMWERETGNIAKMIEAIKELIYYMKWHPVRPVLAYSTNSGTIHIWGKVVTENWSSFAPMFSEIEDNEMYIEREDEFDEPELDAPPSVKREQQMLKERERLEDPIVDIVGLTNEQKQKEKEYTLPTVPVRDVDMKRYMDRLYVKNEKEIKGPKRGNKSKKTNQSATTTSTKTKKQQSTSSSSKKKSSSGSGASANNKKRRRAVDTSDEEDEEEEEDFVSSSSEDDDREQDNDSSSEEGDEGTASDSE